MGVTGGPVPLETIRGPEMNEREETMADEGRDEEMATGEAAAGSDGGATADDAEARDRRKRCELIIHSASVAAAGASAVALVPGSDAVAIMPIQVAMVAILAREHGIAPSASLVKSTVYATLGSIVGKAGAGLLLRWTPVAGNVVRAGVAFSVTEGLGRLVLDRLEAGEGLT
jgi:uncharacterized protein (DUF697 family)